MDGEDLRLPTKAVQRRYSVSSRTLDRWLEKSSLNFPKPMIINGRRYWRASDLERWEEAWPKPAAA
jgi:hypothetical protein